MLEPIERCAHGRGLEAAVDGTADLLTRDEPGIGQHGHVLEDGRQRHGERGRELRHREAVATCEPLDDAAPRRVGERGECAVETCFGIDNHMVYY